MLPSLSLLLLLPTLSFGAAANRGLLASPGFYGQPMRGIYFFPGEARDESVYTAHPLIPADKTWLSQPQFRAGAISRIVATHANVLVLSWWSNMPQWAPMNPGPMPIQDVLQATQGQRVLIMPAIESGSDAVNPQIPHFEFHEDFPYLGRQAGPRNLAPGLMLRIQELIHAFGGHRNQWAQMVDREGVPRYAIHLLHVYADTVPPVAGLTPEQVLAQAFQWIADRVERDMGVKVGFTLDPIPGPRGTYSFSPQRSGASLELTPAVLAVQGYASEVFSGLVLTNGPSGAPYDNNARNLYNLADWKARAMADWVRTGVPVIFDVSSGFDGRFVWFKQGAAFWGDNLNYTDDRWRNALSQFKGHGNVGLTFNTWNGFTEGYAATRTREHGDTVYQWLRDLYDSDPRLCNHVHYVRGAATFRVLGKICEAWVRSGGDRGSLGIPTSNEQASAKGRVSYFAGGGLYWSRQTEAHIVQGLIWRAYHNLGEDRSCLGLPVSDEVPYGANGRVSHFEGGTITWKPGDRLGNPHCG